MMALPFPTRLLVALLLSVPSVALAEPQLLTAKGVTSDYGTSEFDGLKATFSSTLVGLKIDGSPVGNFAGVMQVECTEERASILLSFPTLEQAWEPASDPILTGYASLSSDSGLELTDLRFAAVRADTFRAFYVHPDTHIGAVLRDLYAGEGLAVSYEATGLVPLVLVVSTPKHPPKALTDAIAATVLNCEKLLGRG